MMNRRPWMKALFIVVAVLFSQPASAIMIGLSTEQLTRASQTVIMGRVLDVNSQWNETGDVIVTRAVVAVKEVIRGSLPNAKQVAIEYEGGEVGDVGLKVSDSPILKRGENVVLFLKPFKETKTGLVLRIVGKAQGKYTLGEDGIARKKGFDLLKGQGAVENNIPVNELVNRIRAVR